MDLGFEESQAKFQSASQNARIWSEQWVSKWMYCPNCGNPKLKQFPPNLPVADFFCPSCNDQFELKSQKKSFGKKIANGAFSTKIDRLKSDTSPNLMLMNYDANNATVQNIILIPKQFFTSSIVEKRKPLAKSARRAGWVGSNILIGEVPEFGRIHCVRNGKEISRDTVLSSWQQTSFLRRKNFTARGWLLDVLKCVENLDKETFSLGEVYEFENALKQLYPDNQNIRPKIRQQLQVLRDNQYLDFLGGSKYRIKK